MKPSRMVPILLLAVLVVFGSGCTHSLKVKNVAEFPTGQSSSLSWRPTVGLVFETMLMDAYTDRLADEVASAMRESGTYTEIKYRYSPQLASDSGRRADVDYIVKLEINPQYKGSGWNFLISWPGYLIWTPAWNGFVYEADWSTHVTIIDPETRTELIRKRAPMAMNLRHAAINRTWIEIGWLEIGIIPFVGGIFWTAYDSSVTPELVTNHSRTYGRYIARTIAQGISEAPH